MANSKKLDVVQGRIAFWSLSKLRVNKHIDVRVKNLVNKYEGLGMFDLNIMSLRDRLYHLRKFRSTPTEDYRYLKHEYEIFLMGISLEGNVFTYNYSDLEFLAEYS